MIQARLPFPHADRRAFSLVELLLAVFILGIGIIGISALFPAGIAQQRQANDDIMGPIVADHAMALLRLRLKPEWFGTMEEFNHIVRELTPNPPVGAELAQVVHTYTVPGDWEWKRPGFLFADVVSTTAINELGAIDIFSAYFTSLENGGTLPVISDAKIATENITIDTTAIPPELPMFGIPYKSALGYPVVLISQAERSYPQVAASAPKTKRPAFFWECMFRRFAGRIQVAIFVYRIVDGGGEPRDYVVSQGVDYAATVPPLPSLTDLETAPFARWSFGGLDGLFNTPLDNAVVKTGLPTTTPGAILPEDSWQAPGQWILDEYNTIHRVMVGRRTSKDAANITLTRPIPAQPPLAELFGTPLVGGTTNGSIPNDPGARFIWFMPTSDAKGFTIIPVFATVQEL